MNILLIIISLTLSISLGFCKPAAAVCVEDAPDTFTCNSAPPNPDPDGVQQGANNNGVTVQAIPRGDIDTNNFSAIDLGNGANRVEIMSASVTGMNRAVTTGTGPDVITLHNAQAEGQGSTIFLNDGDDTIDIIDSTVTTTVGGVTISVGSGSDTALISGSTVSTGPNISRAFTGGLGMEDLTILDSVITNSSTDVTVSLGAEDDKIFVAHSTITNANNSFPLAGSSGDDELTIGTGAIIPGGIDCDLDIDGVPRGFDTLIFAMEVPQNQIASVTQQIENAPTPDGSVTINGIFYLYRNCDQLVADLRAPEGRPIPTLSEWALIATVGFLGIAGILFMARRRVITPYS